MKWLFVRYTVYVYWITRNECNMKLHLRLEGWIWGFSSVEGQNPSPKPSHVTVHDAVHAQYSFLHSPNCPLSPDNPLYIYILFNLHRSFEHLRSNNLIVMCIERNKTKMGYMSIKGHNKHMVERKFTWRWSPNASPSILSIFLITATFCWAVSG